MMEAALLLWTGTRKERLPSRRSYHSQSPCHDPPGPPLRQSPRLSPRSARDKSSSECYTEPVNREEVYAALYPLGRERQSPVGLSARCLGPQDFCRSTMAFMRLLVQKTSTFRYFRSRSRAISKLLTTLTVSRGSFPERFLSLALTRLSISSIKMKMSTRGSFSNWNSMPRKRSSTMRPLSPKNLLKIEWALISTSRAFANCGLIRIAIFWASALHSDVFPVPGGPHNSMTLFHEITWACW